MPEILHQIINGAMPGDAITDQALLIRRWLREMGFISEIFAEHPHPALTQEIHPLKDHYPHTGQKYLIYHHSIGSPAIEQLLTGTLRLILIYHNVTPAEFLTGVDAPLARQFEDGRRQIALLREHTELALADSEYNAQDLRQARFKRTEVLPIALDEKAYASPQNEELVARFKSSGPLLLFVGRLAPNKKQDDLIRLLHYYRRIRPTARLILVGDPWVPAYVWSLAELTAALGLYDSVYMMGHVSQQDLVTYYRLADVYISMSEHEGFGKPLIESMYLGLPVLAYASTGVPYTMGEAGVLFHKKEWAVIAETVELLVHDRTLRERVTVRQRQRAQGFLEAEVRKVWENCLREQFAM